MKKYIPSVVILLAFILEWYLLHRLMILSNAGTITTCYMALALIVPLFMWAIVITKYVVSYREEKRDNGKADHLFLLMPFIRLMKSEVGTINGIFSVLFILFNLAWTQDFLLDWIKGDGPWLYPVFTFLWFVAPFVWLSAPKEQKKAVPTSKRKVLITGMSFVYGEPKMSGHYKGWVSIWEPIRACFEQYPNIERVLLLHSKDTIALKPELIKVVSDKFNEENTPEQRIPIDSFRDLLTQSVSSSPNLVEKVFTNVNDFNVLFPELRRVVNGFITEYGYKDEEVLFSITGSTAVMSAGLTYLSMPGQRGCVYSSQQAKSSEGIQLTPQQRLMEFKVDIYSIKELWQEIIEQASGGKNV